MGGKKDRGNLPAVCLFTADGDDCWENRLRTRILRLSRWQSQTKSRCHCSQILKVLLTLTSPHRDRAQQFNNWILNCQLTTPQSSRSFSCLLLFGMHLPAAGKDALVRASRRQASAHARGRKATNRIQEQLSCGGGVGGVVLIIWWGQTRRGSRWWSHSKTEMIRRVREWDSSSSIATTVSKPTAIQLPADAAYDKGF